MADIDISDDWANLFFLLAGERFPAASETAMKDIGLNLTNLGAQIEGLQPDFVAAVNSISGAMLGDAERAFVDAMRQYLDDPGFLTLSGRYVNRMATDFETLSAQIRNSKYMIIATFVEILLTLLVMLAL